MRTIGYVSAATLAAGAIFMWGMAVGHNDQRLFAQIDARAEMQARGVCGERAELARIDGQHVCLYKNPDGESVVRPVFDYPLGEGSE